MDNENKKEITVRNIPATIVSVALHPIFIPLLSCIALYYIMPQSFASLNSRALAEWFGTVFINTVLFPIVLILLLKGLGFIKSIYLRDVKERIIPLIGTMVFYFWAYWAIKNAPELKAPQIVKILFLGNYWGVILVFVITIFYKISMHTSAIGGFVGLIIVLMFATKSFLLLPFAIAILAATLVGWARYALGAHQSRELWLGYVVGIAVQVAAFIYMSL